jgi:hypothetical protein
VFHDLFLQDQAGLHGCIVESGGAGPGNIGLSQTNQDLKSLVETNFPDTGFSFGDVTAFAGKLAVEAAYPCVNVAFSFNREGCSGTNSNFSSFPPHPDTISIAQLQSVLDYTGISARDMAILTAGAHGINGSQASASGWNGIFSTFSSGTEYIRQTLESVWSATTSGTNFLFFTGGDFNPLSSIIRLQADMIFFPSKVPSGSEKDTSSDAASIEQELAGFTTQDRIVFDTEFARVFEKMIAIGGGSTLFTEAVVFGDCPAAPSQITTTPTSTPSSEITTSTTTISIPTTLASTTTTTTATTSTSSDVATETSLAGSEFLLREHNELRNSNNMEDLTWSQELADCALAAVSSNPEGLTSWSIGSTHGSCTVKGGYGENFGTTSSTESPEVSIFSSWASSASTRSNVLSTRNRFVGCGSALISGTTSVHCFYTSGW